MKRFYYAIQTLMHGRRSNIIKVISLTLGLLVSIILFSRVAFELSYDNFYKDVDNLYVIKTAWIKDGKSGKLGFYTLEPMASTIAEFFPDEVESGVTVAPAFNSTILKIGTRKFESNMVMADSLFFHTMGIDVLSGNPNELANPNTIFLSESFAKEMFSSESPIGKTVNGSKWGVPFMMTVKGTYADLPDNVSFEKHTSVASFACIEIYGWGRIGWNSGGNFNSYLRLKHGKKSARILNSQLNKMIAQHIPVDSDLHVEVSVAPLRSAHFEMKGVKKTIWIMSLLGFAILFTATMNYALISISSLIYRAKSIGIHKCNGASEGNIRSMFLYETSLIICVSLLCMGILLFSFQQLIEELVGVSLSSLFTLHNLWAPLSVILFLFIIGGVLPGQMFSSIPVTQVFRKYTKENKGWKHLLLFIQFASVAFILSIMCVVYLQCYYIANRDMGYQPQRIVYDYCKFSEASDIRNNLKNLPYIESTASTAGGNMLGFGQRAVTDVDGNSLLVTRSGNFDKYFLPFLGIRLKAGHNLSGPNQFLVSPSYVKAMGWKGSGIGEAIPGQGTVVGVFEPFCFGTLPADNEPLEIGWEEDMGDFVHIRLKEPFAENLRKLNDEMKRIYPQDDIVFNSLEQQLEKGYHPTRVFRDSTILASITILFITIMGLIGYVNDEVRRRGKEIAIRKVNGAVVFTILRLLLNKTLWIAFPAILIGTGGAYYVNELWLSQFPDIIQPNIGWYVVVSICLLAFVAGCVVWKSWRIANENPINRIKSE